tara:strand:+ start:4313 stop:4600 length:288 start_codon:yes stop_codon:yes gene_type:complete
MSKKWTEVDVYSGLPKNEDAPANFAGAGSGVSLPPDVQISKKKRKLIDARTKEYRQHRAKLEARRKKRIEAKEKANVDKFIEKVKESIKNGNLSK